MTAMLKASLCSDQKYVEHSMLSSGTSSMNGWQQVITGVEFNCRLQRKAPNHVIHLV